MKKRNIIICSLISLFALTSCGGNKQKEHIHSYSAPTFNWNNFDLENNDGNVYLEFNCIKCDKKVIKEADVASDIYEDCILGGYKKYTATFVDDELGGPYTDYKELQISEGKGHDLIRVDAIPATCQRNGNILFYYCTKCGKNFSDENGLNEVSDVSLKRLEHQMTHYEGQEKTCTSDGCIDHYHCSLCNLDYADEEGTIPLTEVILKGGHELIKNPARTPSCCEQGNVLFYECNICHVKFTSEDASETIVDPFIPSTGTLTHHEAKTSTCCENGNIEFYECETCHKKYDDIDRSNILDNVYLEKLEHVWNMQTRECEKCSGRMLDYANLLKNPDSIALNSEYNVPEGYQELYKYNAECGGGLDNVIFFKNESNTLSGITSFSFKILTGRDDYYRINSRVSGASVKSERIPYQAAGNGPDFVQITFSRANASSNTWHVTSSQPDGETSGTALDYTITIEESVFVNSLWGICRIINQNPNNNTWTPVYITEVVALIDAPHQHNWVFNAETNSTCTEPGHIAYYECSVCHEMKDTNGNLVSVVTKPYSHSYDSNGECTMCHKKIFSYADHLQSPSHIHKITDGSVDKAAGYSYVYYYDESTGGGNVSGGFLKHEGNVGLGSWESPRIKKIEFAVKAYDSNSNIRIRNYADGTQHSLGTCTNWVYVTLTLDSVNNKYICTNTANSDVVTCNGNNTMFTLFQLLNDSSMYVTEYLISF